MIPNEPIQSRSGWRAVFHNADGSFSTADIVLWAKEHGCYHAYVVKESFREMLSNDEIRRLGEDADIPRGFTAHTQAVLVDATSLPGFFRIERSGGPLDTDLYSTLIAGGAGDR